MSNIKDMLWSLEDTYIIIIIIYHVFLPPPRRGIVMSSQITHTQSLTYTLSPHT